MEVDQIKKSVNIFRHFVTSNYISKRGNTVIPSHQTAFLSHLLNKLFEFSVHVGAF